MTEYNIDLSDTKSIGIVGIINGKCSECRNSISADLHVISQYMSLGDCKVDMYCDRCFHNTTKTVTVEKITATITSKAR